MKIAKREFHIEYFKTNGRFYSYVAFSFPPLKRLYISGNTGDFCVAYMNSGVMLNYGCDSLLDARMKASWWAKSRMHRLELLASTTVHSEKIDAFFFIPPGEELAKAVVYKRPLSNKFLGGDVAGKWYVYFPEKIFPQRLGGCWSRGVAAKVAVRTMERWK